MWGATPSAGWRHSATAGGNGSGVQVASHSWLAMHGDAFDIAAIRKCHQVVLRQLGARKRTAAEPAPSNLQPFLAHGGIFAEIGRGALKHDPAVAHHVKPDRDFQRDGQFLFDQQDRDAAPGNFGEQRADLLDQLWRQPFGRLVDQDQIGIAHQGAAHRQHLLLAAGEHAGRNVLPCLQIGKQPVHIGETPAAELAGALEPEFEILPHRQRRKDLPVFRHIADAAMRDLVGPQAGNVLAPKFHRALPGDQTHDRLAGGRSADAIAPQQADDFAVADIEVDAVQNVTLAVIGMEIVDFEDHAARLPR
jgi:hypothetical protein